MKMKVQGLINKTPTENNTRDFRSTLFSFSRFRESNIFSILESMKVAHMAIYAYQIGPIDTTPLTLESAQSGPG